MPGNNTDIEEPLLPDISMQHEHGNGNAERLLDGAGSSELIVICDGGEPLRGDVRLNQATATLAATIIGEFIRM
jgi:hypothetical protein